MGNLLKKLENNTKIPMHMPGHKRNVKMATFLSNLRADLDITEIDGFDNLAHPEGILLEYMQKASKIWNSDKSYLLVGGSTCGILTGFKTLTNEGDTVLMCRASHKSMYHALEILGLKSQFVKGEIYSSDGIYTRIYSKDIENALNKNPNIKLVAITSPSYEGLIQDIKAIADVCHAKNIPLMVDEAHGSHLGFTDYFASSAIQNGADLVVQSLHKTLLGLTQTAIMHVNTKYVNINKLEHNLSIFQTSSPSYLLLASICGCIDFVEDKTVFENWQTMLEKFYSKTNNFKNIRIVQAENRDKSKILIDCSNTNINGHELMQILREKYNIELEMSCANYALAMTGLGEQEENLDILANALLEIDSTLLYVKKNKFVLNDFESQPLFTIKNAMSKETVLVTKENAIGKISATHLWVYPPGIPVLISGEKVTKEAIDILNMLEKTGSDILDTQNNYPLITILV